MLFKHTLKMPLLPRAISHQERRLPVRVPHLMPHHKQCHRHHHSSPDSSINTTPNIPLDRSNSNNRSSNRRPLSQDRFPLVPNILSRQLMDHSRSPTCNQCQMAVIQTMPG